MSSAKTTTNHDEIRNWVEKRGGHPAVVAATENDSRPGALLRIDYDEPGGNDDTRLNRISWEEFFRIFDKNEIAFTIPRVTAVSASSSRKRAPAADDRH